MSAADQSYPVFVEYTERHLIWVEASSAETAERWVTQTPWEFTSNSQSFDGWSAVSTPKDAMDWDDVYGYTGGAEEPDMHVQLHRAELNRRKYAAQKVACHEARHPDAVVGIGSIWCPGCTDYLYVEAGEQS